MVQTGTSLKDIPGWFTPGEKMKFSHIGADNML